MNRIFRHYILSLLASVALVPSLRAAPATVMPEQQTEVELSNRDLNRVVCLSGDIEDVKFSGEDKPIIVEKVGADAYIKFKVLELPDGKNQYVGVRSEFFVRCGGAVYALLGQPRDVPAQTVFLAPGSQHRSKANEELLGPLVEEERAVSISMALIKDTIPSSFKVTFHKIDFLPGPIAAVDISERRFVEIEGFDLTAAEFVVRAKEDIALDERMFLNPGFGPNIYAVTIETPNLKTGQQTRVQIVYRGARQ